MNCACLHDVAVYNDALVRDVVYYDVLLRDVLQRGSRQGGEGRGQVRGAGGVFAGDRRQYHAARRRIEGRLPLLHR